VRQTRLPVRRQQLRVVGDGVNVAGQRERDHIRFQPVDHRTRLFAGAAVRGADDEGFAGLLLPLRLEALVDLGVELAGGVVGHVEQFGLREGDRCDQRAGGQQQRGGGAQRARSLRAVGRHRKGHGGSQGVIVRSG
jgi:hypothetical protein